MTRRQTRNAAALPLLMTIIIFLGAGCSSRLDPYQLEIVRAFEAGALRLDIAAEELSDGHSTVYRFQIVERGDAVAEMAGPIGVSEDSPTDAPELFDVLDLAWYIDGNTASAESELLVAFDEAGSYAVSVTASLGDEVLATSRHSVDAAPIGAFEPGRTLYLTLPDIGSHFAVPGRVVNIRGDEPGESAMRIAGDAGGASVITAVEPGFYLITSRMNGHVYKTNVFVSPVPSFHLDRVDRDWYYTQFRTRTTSNCGPTVVSMGISWAKGREVSVPTVRSIIGWTGSGAVSMPELKHVLDEYDVESELHWIDSPDRIFDLLDSGSLVGVVYDMAGISFTENAADNLFGQYYVDAGGHYLAIKGYSLDREYFIVYDPIPSDWVSNSMRYGDGMSMFGRNRYYDVDELFAALRSLQIIEIRRE